MRPTTPDDDQIGGLITTMGVTMNIRDKDSRNSPAPRTITSFSFVFVDPEVDMAVPI